MIPLLHDFTDETVLVFGGGSVGARKARRFAREARVVVVSPTFDAEAPDVGDAVASEAAGSPGADAPSPDGAVDAYGGADRVRAAPDSDAVPGWIDRFGPALVVAATDDEAVNDAVAAAAADRSILVNRADHAGNRDVGSVVVPATVRDDPVVAALATGGMAPVLSRHLRQELADSLDGAGEMARLLSALRTDLREREVPADRRRAILRDVVADSELWTALRTGTPNYRQVIEDVLDSQRAADSSPSPDRGGDPR